MSSNPAALASDDRGHTHPLAGSPSSPIEGAKQGALPADLEVLTVPEAATFLRMNLKTMYKLIDEGRVPFVRIGERRLRLRRSSLLAWLASQESGSRDRKNR